MSGVSAIIFGLLIGSFLNVCIYRIPLGRPKGLVSLDDDVEEQQEAPHPSHDGKKITITYPRRSICPSCNAQLRWFHNLPLVSWIVLRGRCAFCKTAISARYPLVEFLSALVCYFCAMRFGISPTGFVVYAFCASLIVISFIDYDYYIIPNVISLPGTLLGLVVGVANQFLGVFKPPIVQGVWGSVIGVALGAGFLLLVAELYIRIRKKSGLGFGDIKLLAMTGAFFGLSAAFYTIFIGSFLGAICGLLLILFKGKSTSHPIPFGPYLALGTVIYLIWGFDQLTVFNPGLPPAPFTTGVLP